MPTTSLPEKMHISCILYRCSIYFCSPFFQVFKDVKPLLFGIHPPSLSITIHKKTWHPPVKGSNKVHVQDHSCHGRMDVWICLENSIIIIVVIDIFKRVMKCMFRITGTMGTMVKTQQLVLVLSKNIVL